MQLYVITTTKILIRSERTSTYVTARKHGGFDGRGRVWAGRQRIQRRQPLSAPPKLQNVPLLYFLGLRLRHVTDKRIPLSNTLPIAAHGVAVVSLAGPKELGGRRQGFVNYDESNNKSSRQNKNKMFIF